MFFRKKELPNLEKIESKYILEFIDFNLWSEGKRKHILKNINLKVKQNSIVAIIGPSGSGKSSLLYSINKVNMEKNYIYSGKIYYMGRNILEKKYPLEFLRREIGTIFQKPIIFPMSIQENILYALRAHKYPLIPQRLDRKKKLNEIAENSLKQVSLWSEVSDRLSFDPSTTLSLGQQQRLCIARAIALKPKMLLMDEPTSALDINSSNKIEQLILDMSLSATIIIVSHSLAQVKRVSSYTFFIKDGEIIESGNTKKIFTNPLKKETRKFITGEY